MKFVADGLLEQSQQGVQRTELLCFLVAMVLTTNR